MNLFKGAFSVPGYLYNYVAGSKDPRSEPLLEQEEHVDYEGGNASQAAANGAPDHHLTERADSFEAPDLARRAFLEQAKHERVGMQNGLQNGHMQNSEAHINGHANGHAEHTLDIEEVTAKLEPAPRKKRDRTALGLALYALSSCFLATMLMFAKKLGQWGIPPFEVLLARSGFLVLFALIGSGIGRTNPLGKRRMFLLVRGIFGFGAIGNYLFAVTLLPLNDALVLTFTAPIWASVLGPFIIVKESASKAVGIAIILCFAGVALITQPGFLGFPDGGRHISALGVFFALFQALCSALAKMCVRELRTEAPNTSVFYMAAVSLVAAVVGCFLPLAWGDTASFKMPNHWAEWLLLCGVGVTSYGSQFCMTCALRYARAAPALAMSYISIVLTIIYGYYIFTEEPTILSLSGAVLICVSTFSLGAFEKTHPKPSTSPDLSLRGGAAAQDSLGQYEPVPNGPGRSN